MLTLEKALMKDNWAIGKDGEDFVQHHCNNNDIAYRKATKEDNYLFGVDCYIDEKPTDVKNTRDLYFLNHKVTDKKGKVFFARHPFHVDNKATHYCFVHPRAKTFEHVEIQQYLLEHYFIDAKAYAQFVAAVTQLHNKHKEEVDHFGEYVSDRQTYWQFKKRLLPFLQEGVKLLYNEPKEQDETVSFRLSRALSSSSSRGKELLDKFLSQESQKDTSPGGMHALYVVIV